MNAVAHNPCSNEVVKNEIPNANTNEIPAIANPKSRAFSAG